MYVVNEQFINMLDIETMNKQVFLVTEGDKRTCVRSVAKFFLLCFGVQEVVELQDEMACDIAFFISKSSNVRSDHKFAYRQVINLVKDRMELEIKIITKRDIHRTICLVRWIWESRGRYKQYTVVQKLLTFRWLIFAIDLYNSLEACAFSKLKLAVVYSDAAVEDYIFVQYAKYKGVKTATLQHGMFSRKRAVEKNESQLLKYVTSGAVFLDSTADYFLAWNEYTKDEALACGMDECKLVVLGIPKFIKTTYMTEEKCKRNVFGVVLDHAIADVSNRMLVAYADILSKLTGMKYFLKYHPTANEFTYDSLGNTTGCLGHVDKEMTVVDYSKMVDFTLVCNSSTFVELVFLKHLVYRMSSDEFDKFDRITIGRFSNEMELEKLVSMQQTNCAEKLFQYLCCTEDPEEKYREFFAKFI